jgi:chromosome segregation ATPase
VTHAICLACGGNGSTVGRSPELNQFVKHGKEGKESFCEVDILRPGEVATIRRVINSENKGSKWFLNKQKATENQIKGIMNELNIDVNNLWFV